MEHKLPLLHGHYYHIYNRGINKAQIFQTDEDCVHFLMLLRSYTQSVADTLSYALMKNHFHLAIRVRNEDEIGFLDPRKKTPEITAKNGRCFFQKIRARLKD